MLAAPGGGGPGVNAGGAATGNGRVYPRLRRGERPPATSSASREPDLVMIVTSISGRAWGRKKDSEQGATWFSIADPGLGSII